MIRNKQYIVIPNGSRMHFDVPAFLSQSKNLVAFYTDIHSSHFILNLIKFLIPNKFKFKSLKNLLARKLPNELKRKLVKDQLISSLIFFNDSSK